MLHFFTFSKNMAFCGLHGKKMDRNEWVADMRIRFFIPKMNRALSEKTGGEIGITLMKSVRNTEKSISFLFLFC